MNSRNGVDQLFEELEVASGLSMHGIADRVSALLGIDIEVDVLGEEAWARVPQHVLVSAGHARIPIRESDPRWYRQHVVIHELAHLLSGHSRCAELPMTFEQLRRPARACVLAGVGAGLVDGAVDGRGMPESDDGREGEADALARRLGAYVRMPAFA